MTPIDIVIHCGAHKTATTHLQQSFYAQETQLARAGIRFLGPRHLRGRGKSLRDHLGLDAGQDQDKVLGDLVQGATSLLMSEENFMGLIINQDGRLAHDTLYPNGARRLINVSRRLAHHRVHLALAVRNPADLLVSAYAQALLAGHYRTWDDFVAGLDPAKLTWSDLIAPIAKAGTFDTITVWQFENYPKIVPDVLTCLLGQGHPQINIDPMHKSHEGLSDQAVAACAKRFDAGERGRLGALARKDFPVSGACPKYAPWPQSVVKATAASYAQDVARIQDLPQVTVLKPKPGKT
ncbi:MAG: hypothetical protein AAF386_07015 [Pseudomonadota bacterium]